MTITRVKSGDKIAIEYTVLTDQGDEDQFSLSCSQRALPEFYLALNELGKHVVKICELPDEYASGLTVLGVKFTWTDEIMGAVISAKKALSDCDSPLFLNTPHMPEKPYSPTGGGKCLPGETVDALADLKEEAERYVRGERAQLSLFAGAETREAIRDLKAMGATVSVVTAGGEVPLS
jgi:hypothetical protein